MKRTFLLATALCGTLISAAAGAVTVSGLGDGTFLGDTCNPWVSNCGVYDSGSQLRLGGFNYSTITANDQHFNYNVTGLLNDAVIGKLTWVNKASRNTDSSFSASYRFTLDFAQPANLAADFHTFTLNILQPTNPLGDSVLNLTQSGLDTLGPFTFGNLTVSDIHFSTNGAGGSSFLNGAWKNPEDNTSVLYITADFAVRPANVPEPVSVALLGAGMIGLGMARRRRG